MKRDFPQLDWDAACADDCRQLVRLAVREDLADGYDWTTVSLVGEELTGRARIVSRQTGVLAGLRAAATAIDEMDTSLVLTPRMSDADSLAPGSVVAEIAGPSRQLLTAERIVLNLLGRMSGVATQTKRYVDAIAGTKARLYDTRKTTPGWRRLEKYAVRCGGGHNHRTGLYEAVLIKDNHLAVGAGASGIRKFTPAEAVGRSREFVCGYLGEEAGREMIVEIEVDTLEQLRQVLGAKPDLVLVDNMPPDMLRQAIAIRNELAPQIELEASGGITLASIRAVAETGIDRISCGALTHSAINFDLGLDWE